MQPSPLDRAASLVAAVATPIVVVAVAVAIFLNPIWVGFEQGRAGVDRLTGFTPSQVRSVTDSILADLVIGPPSFDVALDGQPVLDAKERGHMADVRSVFGMLAVVALLAVIALLAAALATRGRRAFWRGVSAGATVLAVGVVAVGLFFALFFDAAFTVLHEIFFAAGSWTFDVRTERLVQLFPDQFWFETSLAVVLVVLALSIALAFVGRALSREPHSAAIPRTAT